MQAPERNKTFEKTVHAKVDEDIYALIAARAGLTKKTISAVAREILTAGALGQATAQTVHEEVMSLRALVLPVVSKMWRSEGKTAEEIKIMLAEIDEARFKVARHRAQEAEELRG